MLLAMLIRSQPILTAAQLDTRRVPRPQGFDPGAPPKTPIQLTPFLSFGAEIELEYEFGNNFDLIDSGKDEFSILTPELSLAFSYDPSERLQAFLNVELSQELALAEPQQEKRRLKAELKHAYLLFRDLAADRLSLQIGRQRFNDDREWLYDEELDAIRAFSRWKDFTVQFSVSRNGLFRKDLFDEGGKELINNYLLHGRYQLSEEVAVAAYGFLRDDRSAERERPMFFGLQSSGDVSDHLEYWLELAHVRGRDGSRKIRGWGVDVGFTHEFGLPLKPSITLGYALGTGDGDPNDRVDRSFRQTGLQENEARFNGVTRFKYYGELFDPELSNLQIFTAGIGIRPTRKSSVDLVYHDYLQHKASRRIRGSQINADPSGRSKRLGGEIDLIAGYEEIENLDLKLVLGYFIPGRAFPKADNAFFTGLEIEWNF
jgi:alginate production protein